MTTLRAVVVATHVGPTMAVTVLAGLLAVAFRVPWENSVLLVFAVFLNQVSVGISNDALDSQRDTEAKRWEKPIASGALTLPLAWSIATVAAVASVTLSLIIHPLVALWQGVFILAGWAYNAGLKATVLSGACYAVGFGALPILVSYAQNVPQFPPWWVVFVGACLGLSAHFANVLPDLLVDHRHGVRGLPQRLGVRVVPGTLVALTLVSGLALVVGAGATALWFSAPAAGIAVGFAVIAARAARSPRPGPLPFQLSMAAALVMALGLAAGLTA
jgi:4-hydroxybenzoate polyprenyltransferase